MSNKHKPKKIFVEAMSLSQDHMSGVGHNALEIVRAIDDVNTSGDYEVVLVTTLGKKRKLARHNFGSTTKVKALPIPARALEALLRLRLLPPIDLFLGKGAYLFPNYKKWPLLYSKSFLYVHDTVFVTHPQYVQPKNLRYLQTYLPGWIKKASNILTISEYSKREIERLFLVPSEKITVIPCGVDSKKFSQKSTEEITIVKQRYDVEADHYMLYLGNLEPRKNLENIIKAYGQLPESLKTKYAMLLIGADGWLNEGIYRAIERVRQEGGRVVIPGKYVEDNDLPAFISGAAVLVSPVYYEGFGLSPLQAMACKTPVIVANNSSIPEVVGDAGLYADPRDKTDIAKKIAEILTKPSLRQTLVARGAKRSKLFNWHTSAKKLLGLFYL